MRHHHVIGSVSVAVYVIVALTLGACGSPAEPVGTSTTAAALSPTPIAQIAIGRSPKWIRDYCADAARVVEAPVLCPAAAPVRIVPTGNLKVLRPGPEGYVFEGEAETHWVFGASPGPIAGDYGPMRHLGVTTVSGEEGTWMAAPESAGIHAGHLVLTWRSGGFHYVVSAHTDDPNSEVLRRALVAVASGMHLYR
jgi:hypothetical protein